MANALTVGSLTLKATLRSIGYRAAYTGDDNSTATATVRFKLSSGSTWKTAYAPIVDRRATIINSNDNTANRFQARGSIVGLTANTAYDVELTWVDADGVTGSNPVTGSITTAPNTPTTGGTSYYVASSGGSNGNAGTSSGAPWSTIAFALANTSAGDTINLRGTFAAFTITSSGSAGSFRKLQVEAGQTCTIAGGTNTIDLQGDYWWIHGLTLGASTSSCLKINGTRHHIYLTSCTATNFGTGEVFGTGFVATTAAIHDVFILNNTATRTTATSAAEGVDGVSFQGDNNYNVVVDGNTFTGPMWDGIGNGTNSSLSNFENCDWSNNTITGYYDDSMEMDGGAINLRVWGNVMGTDKAPASYGLASNANGATAISEAGTMVGPSYIFRNVLTSDLSGPIKGGHNAFGDCFYFHNTIVGLRNGGGYPVVTQAGGLEHSKLHTFRNNIIKSTNNNAFSNEGTLRSGVANGNTYDYDLVYTAGADIAYQWNDTTNYSSWASFKSGTGQESHGVNADPLLDGSYHIGSSSPALDAGVSLANFNDADSAWPARGAGPDIGAYEVSAGPRPATNIHVSPGD